MDTMQVLSIFNKLKDSIQKRGSDTLRSLGKVLRQMDSYDNNKKVNKEDFLFGLREIGISLHKNDQDMLLQFLDKDSDGYCNFDEFLVGIRGRPNIRRQAIIDKGFLRFDKEGTGYVNITDVRSIFNCSKHPKVIAGEMSEEQVFALFLKNFNDCGEGKIDRKEWNDYYSAVSSQIDNDDHFVLLLCFC